MMIRPVLPSLPTNSPQLSLATITQLTYAVVLAVTGLTAFLISLYAAKRWNGNKKKAAFTFVGISIAVAALLLCFFGYAVSTVRGTIFCLILLFASYSDIKTRHADDYLHIMIVLAAFIGRDVFAIPSMILSAVLISLPMLLVAIAYRGSSIGGADIKFSVACAFLLGIEKGVVGLIMGLTLGITINLIIQRRRNSAGGFPLIPYLTAGFMVAYIKW